MLASSNNPGEGALVNASGESNLAKCFAALKIDTKLFVAGVYT